MEPRLLLASAALLVFATSRAAPTQALANDLRRISGFVRADLVPAPGLMRSKL
jgi:hypothetical protein